MRYFFRPLFKGGLIVLLGLSQAQAKCPCRAAKQHLFGGDTHTFKKAMCYTQCPPRLGRQGALAMDLLWQQNSTAFQNFLDLLFQKKKRSNRGRAQQAMSCMGACPLIGIQKFMARFLGTVRERDVLLQVGHLMRKNKLAHKGKNHTLLSDVVFKQSFHKIALKVLRHSPRQQAQFKKNMHVLQEYYYEQEGKPKP